ncbi:hypothetical protein KLK36_07325 [Vibrio anguillarum]|nr:hypothetical protein KLK36_07325 [Vibrio anguillarum]
MNNYSIGCDPDSKSHGIAIYKNGALTELHNLNLMQLMDKLVDLKETGTIHVHIENVNGNKAVWHGENQNKKAYGMTSQNVAKCKQAQIEVERMLEKLGIPYTHYPIQRAATGNHKPVRSSLKWLPDGRKPATKIIEVQLTLGS